MFAIKPTGEDCPNLREFTEQLECFAPGAGESCTLLPESPRTRFHKTPLFLKKTQGFYHWQWRNKYFGKQFSILGDSISTLEGYNPKGYNVFYSGDNCVKSGVEQMSDTWWDKVISFLGGELLVNNSWSGSRVTKIPQSDQLFPSGCSNERTSALHINNVKPDVIIVYLGTNDWGFGARIGNDIMLLGKDNNIFFEFAYDNMLRKLKNNYPMCEIWCCTLSETYISKQPGFSFPHKHGGTHIEEYNNIIRIAVRKNKCHLIDLYSYKMPYDSIDGSHPNQSGMTRIATMIIRAMAGVETDKFLDCENKQHEYIVAERYTGCTKYICTKCGKKTEEYSWDELYPPNSLMVGQENNSIVEAGDVILNPNITKFLYFKTLRLTKESTNQTVHFHKEVVSVGSDASCDLLLDSKIWISRKHATFFYENQTWFLRDDFSTNGTWINGVRIQPGKKYQLAAMDEINFAMSERIIFYDFLEDGITTFAKLDYKNEVSYTGQTIGGKYEILKLLSQGGLNTTYLVKDLCINKVWVMKVCDKKNRCYNSIIRETILSKLQMIKKLNHPAIPHIVDFGEDEDCIFVVKDYVEGESLETIITRYGAQPAEMVVEWGKQLCDVLKYLHSLKPPYIYGNMKPENIILKTDGTIKIIDFGIMRTHKQNPNSAAGCFRTKADVAPEQFGDNQTNTHTDISDLGMTMFRLVTGFNPPEPQEEAYVFDVSFLTEGLRYILSKCNPLHSNKGYQTCEELLADLNNYLNLPKPRGILGELFGKK